MDIMKKSVLIAFYYIILCVTPFFVESSYKDYGKYIEEIESHFVNQMFHEFGLICEGRSGMMHEVVKDLGFNFKANYRATLEEARIIQVTAMRRLVKIINGHSHIKPFLAVNPFTPKYVSIDISFEQPSRIYDSSVTRVYNIPETAPAEENRNSIFYETKDVFFDRLVDLHKEVYDEALKIVRNSPKPSFKGPKGPTEEEGSVDLALETFKNQIQKEHYYVYVSDIQRNLKDGQLEIAARFTVFLPAKIKEGRALVLKLSEDLLNVINSNEKIAVYLKGEKLSHDSLKLRVFFVDNKWFSYDEKKSLHSLTLTKDGIRYFRENEHPYSFNPLIGEESYEKAVKRNKNSSELLEKFQPPGWFEKTWEYIKNFFLMTLVYFFYYFGGFKVI